VFRVIRILFLLGLLIAAFVAAEGRAASPTIDVLRVKGTINPVLVDYIQRGINQAEKDNAVACIIQLDTPGGLDTAMRDIVQIILNARVPVVVYVSPSGARAASAGVFITIAAHVAAMAPNTAIGAAHPVSIGTGGEQPVSDNTMTEKVVNDAAAYIRSLAESHGRNADWAEKAVRESVSATEQEALKLNIIDMVTPDLDALIATLDGRKVTLLDGRTITLSTKGAAVNYIDMNTAEDFLYTIANPNIAYILLGIAMLGIMVELYSPGLIFPGVVGGICLLLAFYSLGMLPVNWTGVLLIILAFGLFILEIFVTSFGILAAGGIVSLIVGSLILFKGGPPMYRVDPWLIATVIILLTAFVAFVANRVVAAHQHQVTTGREELVGETAITRTPLEPEGTVFCEGELWSAVSQSGWVQPGEEVIITEVDGLKLSVVKKELKEVKP